MCTHFVSPAFRLVNRADCSPPTIKVKTLQKELERPVTLSQSDAFSARRQTQNQSPFVEVVSVSIYGRHNRLLLANTEVDLHTGFGVFCRSQENYWSAAVTG